MPSHWPEYLKEVSGVLSGLQIVALREVALVPGYRAMWKTVAPPKSRWGLLISCLISRNYNFTKYCYSVQRLQFFFEIYESWYYMGDLPALHWGQKPEE